MIYLFRKFNGQVVFATGAPAWDMYTSNGNWKHRPQYLGAVEDSVYRKLRQEAKEAVPIDSALQLATNKGDQSQDGKLRAQATKRAEVEAMLVEKLIQAADRSKKPVNMNVINRQSLQPHEQQAVEKLTGGHE